MPRGSGSTQFAIHRSSQGNETCGKQSACQKNEQKPIKRSGRQTDWKRRHLAVLRRLAKRNRPARTSAKPLWVVAVLRPSPVPLSIPRAVSRQGCPASPFVVSMAFRSEERRVGKEVRSL